ncbi:hypothetical protein EJV46_04060 [Roseococcus sp. SYP-B2431]|uniref:hypothetical protein n=1 Tax=Roseococcus sp. SYP-B2431 TaxID=2496640 RepID=UPI00103DC1BB|nr:hypothetical protein [Roseococcus sp. SYP-B2431]TCH99850.1 hypothetical protein EJV46_04060 [Roseococcus sp. SYP-B2431]
MITLGEIMTLARDHEARAGGVSERDIELGRQAGMLPADVAAIRAFTASRPGFCIVVRCPKAAAYAWQGMLPAKIGALYKKTGDSGVVSIHKVRRDGNGAPLFRNGEPIIDSALYVSDYDLMGIWQKWQGEFQRVRVTAQNGGKRGGYGTQATEILKRMNRTLVTKIQHGCQDDWVSKDNRGVDKDDPFAGFWDGDSEFLAGAAACRGFYATRNLGVFPYNEKTGKFTG